MLPPAIRKHWALFLFSPILIIGAVFRLSGIEPGYPPYHSDEGISYSSAVSMIKNQNLDPLRYDYPAVVPLVNLFFFKIIFIPLSWIKFYIIHIPDFIEGLLKLPLSEVDYKKIFQLEILGEREAFALAWGRYTTAIVGIGVIILTYLNAKRLFNTPSALVASLLVALSYRQVLNSHLGLPDIYNTFFLLLSFYISLELLEHPTGKRYFFASLFAGISVAVKYQVFALIPLLLIHLLLSFQKENWKERLNFLFSKAAILVPFIVIIVFIIINPYHFIRIEETREWLEQVAGKYRTGRMELDVFTFSYLYKIGLGKTSSFLILSGLIVSLFFARKQLLLLLSIIIPFFFITSFYTGGGFYTRNFVTIIPVLFIMAGGVFYGFSSWKRTIKLLLTILFAIITTFAAIENVTNSLVVASEYSKPWNITELQIWEKENIPLGSKIAAHSSVPIPFGSTRLPFDIQPAFSISEFQELEADYAVVNLDWTTNDFYWWMAQDFKGGITYWNKPVKLMKKSYPAMMIRELQDFAVASFINPWQAYESNFIVAKIPRYKIEDRKEIKRLDFRSQAIRLNKEPWISDPIEIKESGVHLEAKVKRESKSLDRDGFLWIKFYENFEDAKNNQMEIAVRLSSRIQKPNVLETKSLSSTTPLNAKHMTIGYQAYDINAGSFLLEEVVLYNASVKQELNGVKLQPIQVEDDVLFPNSHGGL